MHLVTLQRLVPLRNDGNPGIHTATTSPCLVTRRKSPLSDAAALSGAHKTCVTRPSYSHDRSVFSDTAKSQHSVTLQRLVTISKDVHLGIHTATTSPCLVTRQNTRRSVTPQLLVTLRRHVHPSIHTATTKSCLGTRKKKKSTFSDVLSFSDAQKEKKKKNVPPGIPTATTSRV